MLRASPNLNFNLHFIEDGVALAYGSIAVDVVNTSVAILLWVLNIVAGITIHVRTTEILLCFDIHLVKRQQSLHVFYDCSTTPNVLNLRKSHSHELGNDRCEAFRSLSNDAVGINFVRSPTKRHGDCVQGILMGSSPVADDP